MSIITKVRTICLKPRANIAIWYNDTADAPPVVVDGMFQKPMRPGIGCALLSSMKQGDDAIVRAVG